MLDKFFICIGFDKTELEASKLRGWLYLGMITMTLLALTFTALILWARLSN